MRNISARKKNGKEIQHLHYTITIVFDGGSNVYSERAWSTKLDATLIRVSIGYAFVEIVTELETCHIYKAVLQTI
jgi:hypothetical protein